MIGRRAFITLLGGSAAWPLAVRAQQSAKVARIGHLDLGPPSARASRVEALRAGLRDLGWIEGKNIVLEFRWADGVQQLPELAAELVRMNVDVIFAPSSTMVEPARQATKRSRSYSRTMATRSAPGMWPAFRGPAATSLGCRSWLPTSTPRRWKC